MSGFVLSKIIVHDNAAVDAQPGLPREVGIRAHAGRENDQVGRNRRAVFQKHAGIGNLFRPRFGPKFDADACDEVLHDLAGAPAKLAGHEVAVAFEQRDVGAAARERAGRFQPENAAADADAIQARPQRFDQPPGILNGSQGDDVLPIGPRDRRQKRVRARGENQLVERDGFAALKRQCFWLDRIDSTSAPVKTSIFRSAYQDAG